MEYFVLHIRFTSRIGYAETEVIEKSFFDRWNACAMADRVFRCCDVSSVIVCSGTTGEVLYEKGE